MPTNDEFMLWEAVNEHRARLLDADLWESFVTFERYLVANGFREVEKKFIQQEEERAA